MKRVLVVMTKDTGDEVSASVKVENRNFTSRDKDRLKMEVAKKLLPDVEDALHFRIRYNEKVGKLKGISDSIKVSTMNELDAGIDEMFSKLGV